MINFDLSMEKSNLFQRRLRYFRWVVPLSFFLVATLYQLLVAHWVSETFGHYWHLAIEILFYGTTGPLAAFWVLRLLTKWYSEKELAETSARGSERRLASITAASADAIISVDPTGNIESWNRGAVLIFGYQAREMVGRPFKTLLGKGEAGSVEYEWLADNVRKEGFIREYETTSWGADGRLIELGLTGTYLVDDNEEPLGMSVILRDITNRKRHEEEIQQLNVSLNKQVTERTQELAEKVEELNQANIDLQKLDTTRSEFISLVSHQIRAPLTNMQGAVERMQGDCGAINKSCNRMFVILEQQIARLDQLVQDVLNAARIESGEVGINTEPVSIMPIIHDVVEQFRARSSDQLVKVMDKPGMPLALADRDRVIEVLVNLLDNADKYTPQDKEVIIEVRADQTEVTVSVRDFGPGIPPNDLERVFEKFYRTDSSDSQSAYGYGLGLYVCQRLIEAQGGKIWAENRENEGAVFTFTLPVWQEKHDKTNYFVDR